MKTNINLIKEMAKLGAIKTEDIKNKNSNDIIIETDMGVEKRVILDNVTDEELPLMLMTSQLKTLKSIEKMLKFFYITAILGMVAALILFLV